MSERLEAVKRLAEKTERLTRSTMNGGTTVMHV